MREKNIREEITLESVMIDDSRPSEYDNKISDVEKSKPKSDEEQIQEEALIFREKSLIRKARQESCCYRYFCCNGYFNTSESRSTETFNERFWYWYYYCFYMNNIKYNDKNSKISELECNIKCCDCNECECKE